MTDPRSEQLNLSFTTQELEAITQRARALGMRPAHFGRQALLDHEGRRTEEGGRNAAIAGIISQLSRLGNNLNQMVKRLHILEVGPPEDAEPLLRDIRQLIARLSR
ncbi:MAG TPA: plasmid mobilization relaxosome protein MobC [Pseudolabrys sp.]|nr:plasmid mobilization relaxosome protein MobC [Pseudolabrys sp.]